MANYGFVYVMGNDYMPGIYKIGMTNQSPLRRRDELSSGTAIPSPFDLLFYIEVADAASVERQIHQVFAPFRVSENREFFQVDIRSIHHEFEQWFRDSAPMAITCFGDEAINNPELEEDPDDDPSRGN
jgi:hypothetical protein